jgi:hypothetical protein
MIIIPTIKAYRSDPEAREAGPPISPDNEGISINNDKHINCSM